MTSRTNCVVLGRLIGTHDGWDAGGELELGFYDFEPANGVQIPASSCLWFQINQGRFVTYDDEGRNTFEVDVVTVLKDTPIYEIA